jgi:hypothetical protein
MCAVAPLGGDSSIIAYSGSQGLAWAVADGPVWVAQGRLDPRAGLGAHPRFRMRPSGGLWLAWSGITSAHVSSFRSGSWAYGDSFRTLHRDGEIYRCAWVDVSHDGSELPAVAWNDVGFNVRRDVGCVAVPVAGHWLQGEEIPGSEGTYLSPRITRDCDGDVWAVWQRRGDPLMFFTHTFCRAGVDSVWVTSSGQERELHWVLSEPAPETWWAVLRSREGGPFKLAARLQASDSAEQVWEDDATPAHTVSYRIRRESVDKRFEVLSKTARWSAGMR